MAYRFNIGFDGKNYFVKDNSSLKAESKQKLYGLIKEKYNIKKVKSRKDSVVCIE